MGDDSDGYRIFFEKFLGSIISVDEFKTNCLSRFKDEEFLDESFFDLLDEVFGDADSFTDDVQLLAENPDFFLRVCKLNCVTAF